MYTELWQVNFEQHRLSGMRKPSNATEVIELKNNGIVAIISVLDDRENHQLYNDNDMPFLWLPMTGGQPPSHAQLHTADAYIRKKLNNQTADTTIAIHCSGGNKRTGTLIAGLLVLSGTAPDDAIACVASANPKCANMNPAQLDFINSITTN